MKRLLVAATAGTVLLGIQAAPASAQVITISPAELTQLASQLSQMQQAYQVYKGIFGSLLRAVDPNSYSIGTIGSNPLQATQQVSQMVTGGGSFGPLSGIANQFRQANTFYTPQPTGPDDYNAKYLERSGNTLSGVQAMAQNAMSSIESHITGITDVQQQLSVVRTDADVSAIQGRLQAEQANLAAQGVQAQYLQTMLVAQKQQYELQQMQNQRQSADALLASVTGVDGSANTAGQQMTMNVPTFSTTGP